jgi:uroporphyrinogen III methyltransferase/synthase
VIAGVTSAVAVPECAGIPVTHRGVSRSFHVITGHTKTSQGSPDYDYQTLAKLEGTLVFLMGLSNLGEIAEQLLAAGKAPDTPVAVIANGTTARQQAVRGSLADIDALVKKNALPSPAVIVIGETAGFHFKCEPKKRVGITATKALRRKLARGFEELGMEAVSVCDMELVKTPQIEMLRQEMKHMERYGWVLFTSQNAVSLFFEEWKKSGQDIRSLGKIRFAVLGSGTADKLLEYGIQADFIPSRYVVSVLAEEFAQAAGAGERVLIPRAVQGSSVLTDVLKKHNVEFLDIAVYDVAGSLTENISILDRLDYLVFVSASGVQAFFTGISERGISLPDTVKIVCIGEITEKKLDEYNGKADVVAGVSDVESLLAAVKEDLYGTHEKITDK